MTHRSRRSLAWGGGILGIFILAVVVAIVALDWNDFKWIVTRTVGTVSGRELTIDGDLEVDLGWTTRVRLSRVKFANAPWGSEPSMMEFGLLDFQIKPWEILKGRPIIPSVVLSGARIILEKNADGEPNWDFSGDVAVEAAAPEERAEFPIINEVQIKNSTFVFRDRERGDENSVSLSISELTATGGEHDVPIRLQASGQYQERPFGLSLSAASYHQLRDPEEPYEVSVELTVGDTRAQIAGSLTDPLNFQGPDLKLNIQGHDMADLFPIIGIVFPPTPPYKLSGHLRHNDSVWSFSNFSGKVGDSDLRGIMSVDTDSERPSLKADLTSNKLDFDDLGGFIGAVPETGPGETASAEQKKEKQIEKATNDSLFPDNPIDVERLRAMDARVRLRAKQILAPGLPIDRLDARLSLEDGILRLQPANFNVANGRFEIYTSLYALRKPVEVDLDVRLRRLDLKRLMQESAFVQKSAGLIGGRIKVSGKGQTARAVMRTLSGDIFLVMSGGQVSAFLVELIGLDIAESLGLFATGGDTPVAIRCVVAELKANNGMGTLDTLVADTADTNISGKGKVDLREETVDITLRPLPKDFSLLSLRSSVRIEGPIKDPSFFPDPLEIGTENAFLKAVNAVLTTIAGLFPPIDAAVGEDSDCNALIEQATAAN